MDAQEINDKLDTLLEEYRKLIEPWATAKAIYNKVNEMKKAKLATLSSANHGAENKRSREALASDDWQLYLTNNVFEADVAFYKEDATKRYLETAIDKLRSQLSYIKSIDAKHL